MKKILLCTGLFIFSFLFPSSVQEQPAEVKSIEDRNARLRSGNLYRNRSKSLNPVPW